MMNKIDKIMKTKYLIGLSIMSLMAVSCKNKMEKDVQLSIPTGEMTFYANFGEAETSKTTVHNENEILWTPNDAINVFYGNLTSGKFTATTAEAAAYTQFIGSLSSASGTIETGNEAHSFWAVYPYDALNSCDDKSVTLAVPEKQKGTDDTFAPKTFPAIAQSSGLDLAFYNVCGGMVFTVTNEDIKSVTLSGNSGENLAGTVRVAFTNGVPTVQEVVNGVQSVTLTAPDNKTFVPGTRYYITTLPVSFSGGYQLTFKNSTNAEGTKEVSTEKTINRSRFLIVNEADAGVVFTGGGVDANIIQFADENVKGKLVAAFDTDGDGELSYDEAAAVTSAEDIKTAFGVTKTGRSFDEFQYFTGIDTIVDSMFEGWTLLTSIILPDGINSIGSSAFKNCSRLTEFVVPESVTILASYAFSGCGKLASVTLTDGLVEIGRYAFTDCVTLSSISLPSSLTTIGSCAFENCKGLFSISIPGNVQSIGSYAFWGCTSIAYVNFDDPDFLYALLKGNGSSLPWYSSRQTVHLSFAGKEMTSIVIPEGISAIPSYAFSHCALTSVTIPIGVSSIGDYAFQNCSSLISVTLPEGLSSIGSYAFAGCSSLTSVTFPEGLSSIGSYAFAGCSSLTSVTFPEGLSSIGDAAFHNCSSLTSVTLPHGLSSIGIHAFLECSGLTSITVKATSVPAGGSAMFGGGSNCPIYVPEESVEAYKSAQYWSDYADRIKAIVPAINENDEWDGTIADTYFSYGSGTVEDPYVVATCSQIARLAQEVNAGNTFKGKYFELHANLNFKGNNYTPIGTQGAPFSGNFDGKGKTIEGVVTVGDQYQGFWGYTDGATINDVNLQITTALVQGQYIGGIAGVADGTRITNCCVGGVVNGVDCTGSLVGMTNENTIIENCYSTCQNTLGNIYGSVGGLVGYNCGTIKCCHFCGSINAFSYQANTTGNVVGYNHVDAVLDYCYYLSLTSVMSRFSYSGTLNWGTCTHCDSYDINGNVGSGTGQVLTLLNSWVNSHQTGDNYYRTWEGTYPKFVY